MTNRCCIACGHRYRGPLACPICGEPGEPVGRGGPRPNAGRPPRDLSPEAVTARLGAARLPGESWAALARRLGVARQAIHRARRDGACAATVERWLRGRP